MVPAVNQIEVHPYFRQPDVLAADAEHGIVTQAWSPIGGITFYRDGSHGSTLQDPTIVRIAENHGKSPAQVMLRWHLQQGPSGDPEVGDAVADRREHRRRRLRAHLRRALGDRRARYRRAGAVRSPTRSRSRRSAARSPKPDDPTPYRRTAPKRAVPTQGCAVRTARLGSTRSTPTGSRSGPTTCGRWPTLSGLFHPHADAHVTTSCDRHGSASTT